MQLVAYGAQDIYLTGNPQITFFKVVYRRHTNFSMEAIEQTWNGSSNSKSGRCTATISRNGDLVHRMYLEVDGEFILADRVETDPTVADSEYDVTPAGVDNYDDLNLFNPGIAWVKNVQLEIGGQRIDQHSGTWMETWAELTQENDSCKMGLLNHRGNKFLSNASTATLFQNISGHGGMIRTCQMNDIVTADKALEFNSNNENYRGIIFNIPLQFWFCRNVGLALPLIALQYHEVKVILEHEFGKYFANNGRNRLYADYIYLDTDERRRFAQVSHEYLIEQVQEQQLSSGPTSELNFNHPVKELIWTSKADVKKLDTIHTEWEARVADGRITDELRDLNDQPKAGLKSFFTSEGLRLKCPTDVDSKITLKLNGHERFSSRPSSYFSRTQIKEHHTGPGGIDMVVVDLDTVDNEAVLCNQITDGTQGTIFLNGYINSFPNFSHSNDSICVYSFALKPEEHQPSGTCNFSRIDNANLTVTEGSGFDSSSIIFAVNYNVLRIMSGMGGLAYSN